MHKNTAVEKKNAFLKEFNNDSHLVGELTAEFLRLVYPAYLQNQFNIENLMDQECVSRLQSMTFFRIRSCSADNGKEVFEDVSERFQKLFTALYAINVPVAYGLISRNGVTSLVIGIYNSSDVEPVKAVAQGMLTGIELDSIKPEFISKDNHIKKCGILTGVPCLYVNEEKQKFSLASIMRSLNGQNYTLLFIAKPVDRGRVSRNITELISVRDKAFAVSKRNIARANSTMKTKTEGNNAADNKSNIAGQLGGSIGAGLGYAIGAVVPQVGWVAGAALGGGLGTIIGTIAGQGKSHSEGYSESISNAISKGETISGEIQNGFAIELMNYVDTAIKRLKAGQNNGIWQTAIAYSADNTAARNIIQACLCGELSKTDADKLPMLAFEPEGKEEECLRIPDFLAGDDPNPLCSYINSSELGLLCTVPMESVPDFELRIEKKFPLAACRTERECIRIGNIADGKRTLVNMPFSLSELDLNKHTFVCGITGSGKTTTVKKILIEAKKPFLVIESAKKEYRNLAVETDVYTLGKPEINAPKINPFYIMPGISPQIHIDYLKDLFNASFSFYGPMPYILEKCLHSVYRNKGWDLMLGYHPMLVNAANQTDFFNIQYVEEQYKKISHKYLFPTMQELKDEITRYIDTELKYDGEVAGNIKTAMKIRLENMCVGAKGYTFNTSDYIDFDELLKKNVVFELEGLADDSDKAFSVGLLVIFINEFRQVQKEKFGNSPLELQHLLVIEEAHRLLKNVDTEKSTEAIGNPKGKAVEHFTNMIAEMRSYGQGVIVAEQIPMKLAPDVIKNSSTKIVQRIVSADDQKMIANTIGMREEEAIQLGYLESGYAYCHKEGMAVPAPVKILNYYVDCKGVEKGLDVFVSDEQLYNNNVNLFEEINLTKVRNYFCEDIELKRKIIGFLNTIMCEDPEICQSASKKLIQIAEQKIIKNGIEFLIVRNKIRVISKCLVELIVSFMVRGIYSAKELPENDLLAHFDNYLYFTSEEHLDFIKTTLNNLYGQNTGKFSKVNIAALISLENLKEIDITETIRAYFLDVCDDTVEEIKNMVIGGVFSDGWIRNN